MSDEPIQIKRYPNRRYYSRQQGQYVSLEQIEQMVQAGERVEISDSQTSEDLTRGVLTQIIKERQPEKMRLFPIDMLHFIVRSNDVMAEFLHDYFRHSLTYLDYLQRHGGKAANPVRPMHWVRAWLDGLSQRGANAVSPPGEVQPLGEPAAANGQAPAAASGANGAAEMPSAEAGDSAQRLAQRVAQLEERLWQLEGKNEAGDEKGD